MSLPRLYRKHFRKRAHESYPVWEIGTAVKCGEYGTFHNKLYSRRGDLEGKVPSELLEVDSNLVPGKMEFSSSVDIDFGAGVGVTPAPGTEVNGEIKFGRSGGVYFEATQIVEHRIRHLDDLLNFLEGTSLLDRNDVVVGHVWTFASATLLVTESSDWSLALSGKMPPAGIKLTDGSVNVTVKSGTGERRTIPGDKSIHPMSIRVFGRRGGWWNGDDMVALADKGGESLSAFIDVTAVNDD